MKRAVWTIFFHKLLTNERPQHGVCPSGGDIWCKFKNSASSGVACERKHSLPAAVMDAIKPVFRDLAGVSLLKKCFHKKTHNPNEHGSFHQKPTYSLNLVNLYFLENLHIYLS
jgi:hypothetical protein